MATKRKTKRRRATKRRSCPCTSQITAIRRLLKREDWNGADMLQEIEDIVNPRRR